jgi:tRNA-2-methylthio-N6-dimethylallyladenosine synthase
MGFVPVETPEQADVVMLNTCCVRETAENKVFSLLGRLRLLKQKKPDMIIGVSGCMSQQEGMANRIRQGFPHVDLFLGTGEAQRLPDLLAKVLSGQRLKAVVGPISSLIAEGLPVKRTAGVRAWVPIMYGCDNFCTYCIVPYVRGQERSRSPEHILEEIGGLGQAGFREVVLLGQNVNSYGKDLGEEVDFAWLLGKIEQEATGVDRVRYMTSHPRDFSFDLVDLIANSSKVCEHFHLPVQAGSNKVLREMNRGYTREEYLAIAERIKIRMPQATITTDIMVGFPGENERDFQDTLALVEQVEFDSIYAFIYNTRPGTPAANMPRQVSGPEKKSRIQELLTKQKQISITRNQMELGRKQEVLVEGESGNKPGYLLGRNRGNKTVVFPGNPELIGQTVTVHITSTHLAHLEGEVCHAE